MTVRRPERTPVAIAPLCAGLLVAACASVPAPALRPLDEQVLAIQQMGPEELLAEEARLARLDTASARLLRATVRAAPAHPQRAIAEAVRALEDEIARLTRQRQGAQRDVTAALLLWLRQLQRYEDLSQQRLADDRRAAQTEARLRELERRLQEAERRAGEAERRAFDAERKVEALRVIEREMSWRSSEER